MSLAHSRCLVNIHWANTGTKGWCPSKCLPGRGLGSELVALYWLSVCQRPESLRGFRGDTERDSHTPGDFCLRYLDSHMCLLVKHFSPIVGSVLSRGGPGSVRCSPEWITAITPPPHPFLLSKCQQGVEGSGWSLSPWNTHHTHKCSLFLSVYVCQMLSFCFYMPGSMLSLYWIISFHLHRESSGRFSSISNFSNTNTKALS